MYPRSPRETDSAPAVVLRSAAEQVHPFGSSFSRQHDLVPLFLLRFDRPNTRRAYTQDLTVFFGSDVVTLDMARSVSFTHVNEFVESQQLADAAVSTVRRRVAALRAFFAWLVALGQLDLNPADRHLIRRMPKVNATERVITVLTRDDASVLLECIDRSSSQGLRDYALLLTLLNCVLRRSEATQMDVEHLSKHGPYWVLTLPLAKGGANQTVKIPGHVVQAIQDVISDQGFSSGPVWRSLSRNSLGGRLSGSSVYSIVTKHARRAGILERVGAHTLRHTGCTLAIEAGASIQQVQNHARHKNIETTMLYVHQRDRLAHSAADFIGLGDAELSNRSAE